MSSQSLSKENKPQTPSLQLLFLSMTVNEMEYPFGTRAQPFGVSQTSGAEWERGESLEAAQAVLSSNQDSAVGSSFTPKPEPQPHMGRTQTPAQPTHCTIPCCWLSPCRNPRSCDVGSAGGRQTP